MDPFTIAAIGMGISAIGTGLGLWGSSEADSANQALIAAQQRAEKARYQQMLFDSQRRERQAIRAEIQQQHMAVSNTTLQGANESSGAYGAYGQTQQEGAWNVAGIRGAVHYGKDIYNANQDALAAKSDLADAQSLQQFGSGLSSFGGAIVSNMGAIRSLTTPAPFASYSPSGPNYAVA